MGPLGGPCNGRGSHGLWPAPTGDGGRRAAARMGRPALGGWRPGRPQRSHAPPRHGSREAGPAPHRPPEPGRVGAAQPASVCFSPVGDAWDGCGREGGRWRSGWERQRGTARPGGSARDSCPTARVAGERSAPTPRGAYEPRSAGGAPRPGARAPAGRAPCPGPMRRKPACSGARRRGCWRPGAGRALRTRQSAALGAREARGRC